MPTAGGPVTTYIQGPGGLLLIDTGGTPVYPITNGHGDVAGTTDAAGAFTAAPASDEFGVGTPPSNRLGWLGGKERFSTGGTLDLVRMGVRLYDPALGRFLEVDPIEGGSANDYVYVNQDPVNKFDLAGTVCWKCWRKKAFRFAKQHARGFFEGIATAGTIAVAIGAIGGCAASIVCGVAVGVGVGAAMGAWWGGANHEWDHKRGHLGRDIRSGAISGGWQGGIAGGAYSGVGKLWGPGKAGWEGAKWLVGRLRWW